MKKCNKTAMAFWLIGLVGLIGHILSSETTTGNWTWTIISATGFLMAVLLMWWSDRGVSH